jgi:hypothetical protein
VIEQLQPILDAFSAKYGWGPALVSWVSGLTLFCRVVIKPFNLKLQAVLTAHLADGVRDPDDAAKWHALLSGWPYTVFSLLLDMFTSVKLPSHADFHRLLKEQLPPTGDKPEPVTK